MLSISNAMTLPPVSSLMFSIVKLFLTKLAVPYLLAALFGIIV